jgi:hypothetical protein
MTVLERTRNSIKCGETTSAIFSSEEARALFDNTAKQYMGMSGNDFLDGWDSGKFRDAKTKPRAMRVAILIPLVRKTSARKQSR